LVLAPAVEDCRDGQRAQAAINRLHGWVSQGEVPGDVCATTRYLALRSAGTVFIALNPSLKFAPGQAHGFPRGSDRPSCKAGPAVAHLGRIVLSAKRGAEPMTCLHSTLQHPRDLTSDCVAGCVNSQCRKHVPRCFDTAVLTRRQRRRSVEHRGRRCGSA
jgi:hypothetical protein